MGRAIKYETSTSTDDVIDEWHPEIDDDGTLHIHGTVTCPSGKIIVKAYSVTGKFLWWVTEEEFIGGRSNYFEDSIFYVAIDGVDGDDIDIDELSIRYTIEPEDD